MTAEAEITVQYIKEADKHIKHKTEQKTPKPLEKNLTTVGTMSFFPYHLSVLQF